MAEEKKTKKAATAKKKAPVLKKATQPDKELQDRLKQFIGCSLGEMMEDFKGLTPAKKWELIIQLLPYATPKMQATDVTTNGESMDPLGTQLGQLANSLVKE